MKDFKIRIRKLKNLTLKHKVILLVILTVSITFISWEAYAIHTYRQTRSAVSTAQMENDFKKAEKKLFELQKITKRSLILSLTRKANVEFLINTHKAWRKSQETINSENKESSKNKDFDFNSLEHDESQTQEALPFTQPSEPTNKNQGKLELQGQEFDFDLDWEFFTFPDFTIDSKIFKKDYSCTNEQLDTLTKLKGEKLVLIAQTEGLQITGKSQCKLEIEANLLNCKTNCDNQRTRMEVILACREQCENEWNPIFCDYYYDNPDHEYNKQIATLKKTLQEIQKALDICWAERSF